MVTGVLIVHFLKLCSRNKGLIGLEIKLKMPEFGEYKQFAAWLRKRIIGAQYDKLLKCRDYAGNKQPDQEKQVSNFNLHCSKIVQNVLARGKELAIVFTDESALRIHLATGGYFSIGSLHQLRSYPLKEHVNFVLRGVNLDSCLFVVETAQCPNFVTVNYEEKLTWGPNRGPDLLNEKQEWDANIERHLASNMKRFKDSTLFDLMHDQQLFNGFGGYSVNEICERLFIHYNLVPWTNALTFLASAQNRKVLRIVASEFFAQINKFVGADFDCTKYKEQDWLNFSNLFLLVYRKETRKNKPVNCYTAKNKTKVYTTALMSDQELEASGWTLSKATRITPGSLVVGMAHWHSAEARAKLFETDPQSVVIKTAVGTKNLEKSLKVLAEKRKASSPDSSCNSEPSSPSKKAKVEKKPVYIEHCFDGVTVTNHADDQMLDSVVSFEASIDAINVSIDGTESTTDAINESTSGSEFGPNEGSHEVSARKHGRMNKLKRLRLKNLRKFQKIRQNNPLQESNQGPQ